MSHPNVESTADNNSRRASLRYDRRVTNYVCKVASATNLVDMEDSRGIPWRHGGMKLANRRTSCVRRTRNPQRSIGSEHRSSVIPLSRPHRGRPAVGRRPNRRHILRRETGRSVRRLAGRHCDGADQGRDAVRHQTTPSQVRLTGSVQLRRTKQDRAVDTSAASASAHTQPPTAATLADA